jgi:bifunctional polynucleotide phosphatase/kinase
LAQAINAGVSFALVIEPLTQALAQYKLFPDLDEFVDTLQLSMKEFNIASKEKPAVQEQPLENLWQIPTFDEDIRIMNRKPSLLAFKKRVEGAFSQIGRPLPQDVEQRTSSKLGVPSTTLYSGGYTSLSSSSTLERTNKLEEARKTLFSSKSSEVGITSSTPYQFDAQSSFASSPTTTTISSTAAAAAVYGRGKTDLSFSPQKQMSPPEHVDVSNEKRRLQKKATRKAVSAARKIPKQEEPANIPDFSGLIGAPSTDDLYGFLLVSTLTGKRISIKNELRPTSTVLALKQSIQNREGIPTERQRIIYAGKQLEDTSTLRECRVPNGATFHLVLRLGVASSKSPSSSSTFTATIPSAASKKEKSAAFPTSKKKLKTMTTTKKLTKKKKRSEDELSFSDSSNEHDRAIAVPSSSSSSMGHGGREPKTARKTTGKLTATIGQHWTLEGTVWIRGAKLVSFGATKVAAFDMDQTLIQVKSGAKFPRNKDDWKWMCPEVPTIIREAILAGFQIVIMTNQAGIQSGSQAAEDILMKIDDIAAHLAGPEVPAQVPILAMVATSKDMYRKPSPILWNLFIQKLNQNVIPGPESYFVGDAAGRSGDHSAADRCFAHNAGVTFMTEDVYFKKTTKPSAFNMTTLEHPLVTQLKQTAKLEAPRPYDIPISNVPVEIVIMCGLPGSGKSTIYKTFFEPKGYRHINLDTEKSSTKCMALATEAIVLKNSIVVDQTFPGIKHRQPYIDLAKQLGVPIRCIYIDTPIAVAKHLMTIRNWLFGQPIVPKIGYVMYSKHFVRPSTKEGFESVIVLPFQFASSDPTVHTAIQWYTGEN